MTAALVGRDVELATLDGMLATIEEQGHAVLIHGDAGIGKSSLLHELASSARGRAMTVLETTGVESESDLPYAGLHRLLLPLLGRVDSLPTAQRRALLTALGLEDGPAPQVFLVALAALTLITERAAARPVLAVIDDIHWLDAPSSETVGFIARRVGSDPVVVVATLREGHTVASWRRGELDEIALRGLDADAARALLDRTAGDLSQSDRELILRQAGGNPLALVELPGARRSVDAARLDGAAHLPLNARLERAFASRLPELPDVTRDALLVAAVDPGEDVGEILEAASLISGRAVTTDVLDPAAAAGLVTFDVRRVRFRHPLVRSGILQSEPSSRRQAAHAALAAVLADQPYRQIWHRSLSITGTDDAVADELEGTYGESLRRGWVEAAISALERAAELTSDSALRGRRLLLAAEIGFGLGRADLVDRLVSAAERTSLSELDRARVEWLREIFNDGIPGDAGRVLELGDVAERSAAAGETDLALNLLLGAALRCWWADTGPEARARIAEVAETMTWATEDPRHVACLAVAEPILQGATVIDRLSGLRPETIVDPDALRVLGMAAHAVGDQVRAAEFLDRAENRVRAQGRLGLLPHVLGMQGAVHIDLGDWSRASTASEEGRRVAADTGQPVWSTGTLVNEARVCGLRGDSDRALELAAEAENSPTLRGFNDFLACAQQARGFAHLTRGRYAEAYVELARLFDPEDPAHHQREKLCGVMFLAEAAAHCGQLDGARVILADMERTAVITPSPALHVNLLYARAVLADDDEAEGLYRAALRCDLSRWPWHRARIQLAFGIWLRRQRRVAESRDPLRSALTTLEVIGATAWAEQARAELRAAGERMTTTDAASAAAALSPQELQIARLAAAGHSNREIGEQLFLSPRTVGSHLYRIFPKLGITSRAQLAHRIDGVGLAAAQ